MFVERYLGQIRTLRYQIKCKQKDAEMWRELASSMAVGSDGDRVQKTSSQDRMADAIAKAVDCEADALALVQCLVDLQKTILWQIDHMESDVHRIFLNEYYVHDMSLADIANEWKKSFSHVKRVKSSALKAFSAKYGENFRK